MNIKNQEKNKIREKILTEKYGRFFLVERIIKEEEIISLPPRILLTRISDILSIEETLISTHAFYAWHRRYRKAHIAKKKTPEQIVLAEESSNSTEEPDAWLDWKPSDAALKSRTSSPLIIKAITK